MYNVLANGGAEAFNKTLCSLLKKVVSKSKLDRHKKLKEVLWAYRASYGMLTQSNPINCILPYKRGSMEMKTTNSDWQK